MLFYLIRVNHNEEKSLRDVEKNTPLQ